MERAWECRIARKPLRGGCCRTEAERSFHFPRSSFQRERYGRGDRARRESTRMGEMPNQRRAANAHMRTELLQGIRYVMSNRLPDGFIRSATQLFIVYCLLILFNCLIMLSMRCESDFR